MARRDSFATANEGINYVDPNSLLYTYFHAAIVYRIYLDGIKDCNGWVEHTEKTHLDNINDIIIQEINKMCNRIIPDEEKPNVISNNEQAFECQNNILVYSAQLHSIKQVNTSTLVSCLDNFIQENNEITVGGHGLKIMKECTRG